jgi:hypothetical protein
MKKKLYTSQNANEKIDLVRHGGTRGGEMALEGDDQLSELERVRKPGLGKLNVGEAINTAIEQGVAYEEWQEFGAPTGVIEVWVEAQRVMTLEPGETSDLEGVLFKAPQLKDAVVQVVRKADEIADTVVLLNRKLQSVPVEGVELVENHPNDQTVILKMKPVGNGQISIWVGFGRSNSVLDVDPEPEPKPRSFGAAARTAIKRWIIPQPELVYASLVFVVTFIATFGALSLRQVRGLEPADTTDSLNSTGNSAVITMIDSSSSCFAQHVSPEVKSDGEKVIADLVSFQAMNANASADTKPVVRIAPLRVTVTTKNDETLTSMNENAYAHSDLLTGENIVVNASDIEPLRLRRLAKVRSMFVQVDEASQANEAQKEEVFVSVSKALNELGISVVDNTKKSQADGTMLLRVETDPKFGVIIAVVRDRDENFLWQQHADCGVVSGISQGVIFGDASTRLINKLALSMKLVTKDDGEKTQMAAKNINTSD